MICTCNAHTDSTQSNHAFTRMLALLRRFCMRAFPVQDTADTFTIDYSLGKVSGEVAIDTVSLGTPNFTVFGQVFGLVENATADFENNTCDGVFVRPIPLSGCHGLQVACQSAILHVAMSGGWSQPMSDPAFLPCRAWRCPLWASCPMGPGTCARQPSTA